MPADLFASLGLALAKGAVTALSVAGLLVLARRWDGAAAGRLAGLPTITGPALLWLALDGGPDFAAAAATGAVAAGICCALFAVAYVAGGRHQHPAVSLALGVGASLLPLPWMVEADLPPWVWLVLASLTCWACRRGLARLGGHNEGHNEGRNIGPAPSTAHPAASGWRVTALSAGLVSVLAAGAASHLPAFSAGLLTSPPLLAACVALELHRQTRDGGAARAFLAGYIAGLLGRSCFGLAVAVLIVPLGPLLAFTAAVAVCLPASRLRGLPTGATLTLHPSGVTDRT